MNFKSYEISPIWLEKREVTFEGIEINEAPFIFEPEKQDTFHLPKQRSKEEQQDTYEEEDDLSFHESEVKDEFYESPEMF